MSLYQQFANSFTELNPPTTFDSPLTLSALSPFNSGTSGDSVTDHLAGIDLSGIGLAATFGTTTFGTTTSLANNSSTSSSSSSASSSTENPTFSLNPSSVERILHIPHVYSPVTPPTILTTPDRSSQTQAAQMQAINMSLPTVPAAPVVTTPQHNLTNGGGKINSITTSVIVANSSITSSTTATISKSNDVSRSKPHRPVTSSTVSTIVMQSTGKSSNSSSSSSSSSSSGTSNNHSSNGSQSQHCLVCGDTPLGKNFGVVTCGSCKIFFRRNIIFADKTKSQCRNNNRCSITKTNRRNCAACRLRKCIDLGMKVKQSKQPKVKGNESLDELNDLGSQDAVPGSLHQTMRVHSQQSSASEEDDEGYRDLPSLISVEEVRTRLQDRRKSAATTGGGDLQNTDTLLDEVNSVIIEHIKEEVEKQHDAVTNGSSQLDQIASAIENLSTAATAAGHLYSSVGGGSLLESIEELNQQNSSVDTAAITPVALSSVIISNAHQLAMHPQSEPAVNFPSVIKSHQSSPSASLFTDQRTALLQATATMPDVEEVNVEEEEKEEEEEEEEEEDVENVNNDKEEEEVKEEADETDVEEGAVEQGSQFTNGLSTTNQQSSLSTEAPHHHYESSDFIMSHHHQQQQHSQSCNSQCGIDLTLPECIAKSKHERLMYFYQQQQAPYLSCGFQNVHQDEKVVVDGFNRSNFAYLANEHDGQRLHLMQRQRRKRLLNGDFGPDLSEAGGHDTMELVKVEAKNLGSPNHTMISELMKMTSLIRIKLGIEYATPSNGDLSEIYQLNTKELHEIANLNTACRMIDLKPNTETNTCTHVYDSLRHGIFYANRTFKIFEEFWLQNKDMRELIRQDETRFDRKRNNLLHMLYHCRGVYNYDEEANAWAVSNGNNQNTFAYIKLTMFNESIKKEMSNKHYQYIQSFPKEWRQDPTVFNLMTFLLIFGAFKEMHSQSKYEKIRFQTILYLVKRHFEDKYRDSVSALQMLNHMLQLIEDLEPLSSDCLTACTHSLNPKILERIGPNYAACLMLEMKQKREDEEHRRRRKHSRHSESSSNDGVGGSSREQEKLEQEQQEQEQQLVQQQLEQFGHCFANGEFP